MRTPLQHSLSVLLAIAALWCGRIQAQNGPKIATMDLKRVFDNYWKTKQADATLKERAMDFEKAKKGIIEDYQKSNEDYKKLIESANDVAVSSEEKEKRKTAAEKKLIEIKDIEDSLRKFNESSKTTLMDQQIRMRDKILVDIKEIIASSAKAGSYAFVVDTAAESANRAPIFLFWDGKTDITEMVLSELNRAAPAQRESAEKTDEKDPKKEKEKPENKK